MDVFNKHQFRIKPSGNFQLICSCRKVEIGNRNKTMHLAYQPLNIE